MSKYQIDSNQLDLLNGLNTSDSAESQSKSFMDEELTPKRELSTKENNSSLSEDAPEMILIIDTETTGLDADKDKCIEVGSILFSVSNRSILAQQSFLIPVDNNKAEFINGIPAQITKISQPLEEALKYFSALINSAEILVAHNASFDKQWFGKSPLPSVSKPWLCSMDDITWPLNLHLRARPSVRDLALAYEVPVWNAHRALTDCIYIAEVFKRCKELEQLLIHGLEPRKLMKAQISYEQRYLAREAGFRWNDPIQGSWSRRLSEREASALCFPVVLAESSN